MSKLCSKSRTQCSDLEILFAVQKDAEQNVLVACVSPIFRILQQRRVASGLDTGSGVRAMVMAVVSDRVSGRVGNGLRWGGFVDIVAISHHARGDTTAYGRA